MLAADSEEKNVHTVYGSTPYQPFSQSASFNTTQVPILATMNQSAPVLNVPENPLIPSKQKFDVVKDLKKALSFDFEGLFNSKSFDKTTLNRFEATIHNLYLIYGSTEWRIVFKKTTDEWRIFGEYNAGIPSLAFIGLLRVLNASGYKVDLKYVSKIPNEYGMMYTQLNAIFKQVTNQNRNLRAKEIYQALLWFFAKFLLCGTPEELEAVKKECPIETRIVSRNVLSSPNKPVQSEAIEISKFDVVKCLEEAIDVDLDKKFTSNSFDPQNLSDFESDIYYFYEKMNVVKKSIWATIFKRTLQRWDLFGTLVRLEELAFYGLARICEAKHFSLDPKEIPKISNSTTAIARTNKIFKQISGDALNLEVDKVYQTLLGFYGRFRYNCSHQELRDVKKESTVEKIIFRAIQSERSKGKILKRKRKLSVIASSENDDSSDATNNDKYVDVIDIDDCLDVKETILVNTDVSHKYEPLEYIDRLSSNSSNNNTNSFAYESSELQSNASGYSESFPLPYVSYQSYTLPTSSVGSNNLIPLMPCSTSYQNYTPEHAVPPQAYPSQTFDSSVAYQPSLSSSPEYLPAPDYFDHPQYLDSQYSSQSFENNSNNGFPMPHHISEQHFSASKQDPPLWYDSQVYTDSLANQSSSLSSSTTTNNNNNTMGPPATVDDDSIYMAFENAFNDPGVSDYFLQYHGLSSYVFNDFQPEQPSQQVPVEEQSNSNSQASSKKRKLDQIQSDDNFLEKQKYSD